MSDEQHLKIGLPQGLIIGPLKFTLYCSPFFDLARRHGLLIHMYADETQLYFPFYVNE